MPQPGSDRWHDGSAYEAYVGRWSRRVAERFLPWLGIGPAARWVDVGCGTGVLAGAILDLVDPASVVGVDPSPAFIATARSRVSDARVTFREGTAEALGLADGAADVAAAALVLNFVPDVSAALRGMRRAAAGGGTVAAYVWDYAGEMQLLRRFWDAAVALDPAAATLDEGARFPICRPERLEATFSAAGLADVTVSPIDVPTVLADFDDFWTPFLSGVGPAPGYVMGLDEPSRERLRDRLDSTLPRDPDGTIPLIARAWAVRGRA